MSLAEDFAEGTVKGILSAFRPKKCLLIIEDNADDSFRLAELLARMGHDSTTERTAEAAAGRLRTEKFDHVFLDLGLPMMDGWTFRERFKEELINTIVVITTGLHEVVLPEGSPVILLRKNVTRQSLEWCLRLKLR